MSDRSLFAAFFLPLAERLEPVTRQLAVRAGMTELVRRPGADPTSGTMTGIWADMYCTASSFDLRYVTVLAIGFPQAGYFDLLQRTAGNGVESIGQPLVTDFVATCVAMRPFFALVTAFPRDDLRDYCAELEDPVIGGNADELLSERLMLTYLTGREAATITHPVQGRDHVPVPGGGMVLFAGEGANRWP